MSSQPHLLNDCFLHDKDRMRHDEVVALLKERLSRTVESEQVDLGNARGRYLAETVSSPRNVPLHDNSAVDGYAFKHADYQAAEKLTIKGRVAAGDISARPLEDGSAVRIFTGAAMPPGTDTVAMQEDCEVSPDGDLVTIPPGLSEGANRRLAGEDLKAGERVMEIGDRLRPQDLATLASIGLSRISAFKKLRIALVSSGNELVSAGSADELQLGQVFDSNRIMLDALCRTQPVDVLDLGVVADDPEAVHEVLSHASGNADLILTSGGASRGDEDYMIRSLERLGKRHLWQIAIKPGRPMCMGQIKDCVYVGLPGNPVAAFVCFLLYCLPVIQILTCGKHEEPMRIPVPSGFEIPKKKVDRREFMRGWLSRAEDGTLVAQKFPRDGSGLISGLRQADGLIEIPEDVSRVEQGDIVSYIPFSQFGILGS